MKKHEWKSFGCFTYICSICGDFDSVSKDYANVIGIAKEQERILNRTDCDELFVKHKIVPRLLGKPTAPENRRVTRL